MLDSTGLRFEQAVPGPATLPNRADVACFIGFVARSSRFRDQLPLPLRRWLRDQGLVDVPGAPSETGPNGGPNPRVLELLQLPVPIDSWSTFTDLFEWRGRPLRSEGPALGVAYLAAAVRSFFAQGGRKCFVVRVGDPTVLTRAASERSALVGEVLPAWNGNLAALSPEHPERWLGIAHLFGLSEASFVCLPDLPWLLADDLAPPSDAAALPGELFVECPDPPGEEEVPEADPERPEAFVECSTPAVAERPCTLRRLGAPRFASRDAYRRWGRALNLAAQFLAGSGPTRNRKDVQLVAAIPMPSASSDAAADLLAELVAAGILDRHDSSLHGVASAYVQLAYPWLGWEGSAGLPEGLEPPDGALVGVLARGTLLHGAFTNFADQPLRHVQRLEPALSLAQMARLQRRSLAPEDSSERRQLSLRQRVSLFGVAIDGIELLADVTTSTDEAWRPASVNRLMSVWVRALQRAGELFVFEPSNELTWQNVQNRLELIGESLFRSGALAGRSPREAFAVRCDRSTISNADLAGGRLIAEVQFRPAIPIEGIVIGLGLDEAQRISVSTGAVGAGAA